METNPDIVIIDTESPTRDVVEQVCVVTQNAPRPSVMFTADGESASIQAALQGDLGCGTQCGSCLPEIRRLLREATVAA